MDAEIETKKIMRNAIIHYAGEKEKEVKELNIKIYTEDAECNPKYKLLSNFKDEGFDEITLKQLMLVPKVDFTGKGLKADLFVQPKIKGILNRLSKEQKIDSEKVSVIIATNDNECNDLRLILCINEKPLKLLSFGEIFGD